MITISLCMIVKNEEDVLARCLDCAKDIVDEIIIVDTGSTDNTKKIAKNYTSKVYDFKWIDDFSAARNFPFSKATMDYILWLDADDIILESDIEKFKIFKQTIDNSVNNVMMKYNVGFDESGNVNFSYYRERLVKKALNPLWKEPIHEYLELTGSTIIHDICITHKKEHPAPTGRNLKIYEALLSQGKQLSIRGLYYYARELYYNERFDDAIKYFNAFLYTNKGWVEDRINACFILSTCYYNVNNKEDMRKILLKSFEFDNPRAEICCQLGYYYFTEGKYNDAIFWYNLAASSTPPTDSCGFVSHDHYGYIPNIQLCLCYDKLGNIEEAIKYNNIAGEYKPNSSSVLYNKKYFDDLNTTKNQENLQSDEHNTLFNLANKFLAESNDTEAKMIYEKLLLEEHLPPVGYFRLGEIENRSGRIKQSYIYHKKAFELDNALATKLVAQNHPHYNYVYTEINEYKITKCPLCSGSSKLHSCYNMITNIDQIFGFNPIRKWRICDKCNHIFAENFPKNLDKVLSGSAPSYYIQPNTRLFPIISGIVSNIRTFSKGNKFLEIGVGAGEMLAVAKEMQFDVSGLDIRPVYASKVAERLKVPVHGIDIMNFESNELYDVIVLGDIIEHVSNPIEVLNKCYNLLSTDGVLWISTPNFESAFSYTMKDMDPMWRVCEHLNYFSYDSLKKVLNNLGFEIKDYKVSEHYNGSMEVIAKKAE